MAVTLDADDESIGVKTLAMEARGEILLGQQAVAWVLRNRLESGIWGQTLQEVCLWNEKIRGQVGQGFQFSGWRSQDPNFQFACRLRRTDPLFVHLQQVFIGVMHSFAPDPTGGARFYYRDGSQEPEWAASMSPCGKFGNQLFFKSKE